MDKLSLFVEQLPNNASTVRALQAILAVSARNVAATTTVFTTTVGGKQSRATHFPALLTPKPDLKGSRTPVDIDSVPAYLYEPAAMLRAIEAVSAADAADNGDDIKVVDPQQQAVFDSIADAAFSVLTAQVEALIGTSPVTISPALSASLTDASRVVSSAPACSNAAIATYGAVYVLLEAKDGIARAALEQSHSSLVAWFDTQSQVEYVQAALEMCKITTAANIALGTPAPEPKVVAPVTNDSKSNRKQKQKQKQSQKQNKSNKTGKNTEKKQNDQAQSKPKLTKEQRRAKMEAARAAKNAKKNYAMAKSSVATEQLCVEEKLPFRLPENGKRNILITSALPYVNNVPHLGNIIGCVLSADVFARFCRQRGYNAIYISGTDEYGTATETKAMQENITPQQICDKYHAVHRDIYKWFNIGFDYFGRTTTPEQTEIAQDIFNKNDANGNVNHDEVKQFYCTKDKKFLADRFIEGHCPSCGYEDARGDQCDACQKLLNPDELVRPRCKFCSQSPEPRTSKHLFLNLPKLRPSLEAFVNESSVKGAWTSNSTAVTRSWLNDDLRHRCISRDLNWGTPVPKEGYTDKVFYVWFDAPIGYISMTKCYAQENWEKWWKNPEQVQLYQFMGKDNIPFHTVIFPSSLIGSGDPYTMLHHISTTEYLNYEAGMKFSKSRGTGVFGDHCKDTGIPSEVWRFYLLSVRPESSDTAFSWTELRDKTNADLLGNLANFVNRALKFSHDRLDKKVPSAGALEEVDEKLISEVNAIYKRYLAALDAVHIREASACVTSITRVGNQYLQDNKPWVVLKTDRARCETIVNLCIQLVRLVAAIAKPFMPALSVKICRQLNWDWSDLDGLSLEEDEWNIARVPAGHELGAPAPLVAEITVAQIEEFRKRFGAADDGKDEKSFPLDLKTATVVSCEQHAEDEGLFVLSVDLGNATGGKRQLVARIAKGYAPAELLGKTVIVVCNLKPTMLKNVESHGMILCAKTRKGDIGVLTVDAPIGTVIAPKGFQVKPDAKFNPRGDLKKLKLKINKGNAVSAGVPLVVDGSEDASAAAVIADNGVQTGSVF
jgi:methionyl-tRNA synthetase